MILLILFLSPFVFSTGIHFTSEQCQRFKIEGITGSDYYINEALYRDCGISQNSDLSGGEFSDLVLNVDTSIDNKKNCDLKNQALNNNNSGYLQDVVTFNDMHPDYFYPDRADEYPFVFGIQVPTIDKKISFSNGVSVDIDSVDGCRQKVENLLGEKLKNKNVIMTAGHSFIRSENNNCYPINKKERSISGVATGSNINKYNFASRIDKIVCASKSCNKIKNEIYEDFCIVITEKEIRHSAHYKKPNTISKTKLVAYQPALISHLKNRVIEKSERVISVNDDPLEIGKNQKISKTKDVIFHHADAASGASGGGLFDEDKNLVALHISEGLASYGQKIKKIQKGVKGTWRVNQAINPQIACQRLSTVLN